MFDENTEKILKNKELVDLITESLKNEDFYISDKKISYSLKECLMSTNDDFLKMIYLVYNTFVNNKVNKKDMVREKMIDFLLEKLPESFASFLETLNNDDIDILNAYSKNKKANKYSITFLSNGFMFGFREKEEDYYVIPDEFVELYKNNFTLEMNIKKDLNKLQFYILSYLLINGMISKKFFNDLIINYYNLDLSVKEIEEYIKNSGITIYKNKYYSLVNGDDSRVLEDAVKLEKNESYCVLDEMELLFYSNFTDNLVKKMAKIVKADVSDMHSKVLSVLCISEEDIDYYLERFSSIFELSDKQLKKVKKIIEEEIDNIRFWAYHGYTSDEYFFDLKIRENTMLNEPKDTSLKSCLEALSSDVYNEISNEYALLNGLDDEILSVDELSEMIIEKFKMVYEENSGYYNELSIILDDNNSTLRNIDISDIELGFVFTYYQGKKLIGFIPDEINNIIIDELSTIFLKEEYIFGYIKINGVLEKIKLQQLLKENHNIDLSIKELDNICDDSDVDIIDNKYYSIIDEKLIKGLIPLKDKFSVYKKFELSDSKKENDLFDDLYMFFEDLVDDDEKSEGLTSFVIILIHSASYSDDILRTMLESEKISIKDKDIKKLIGIIQKYKNDIAVWQYNGISLNEYNSMKKVSNKIGRNEPCSCGSGKKYKHCCGR